MKLTSYSTVALALLAAGVEARGQKRHSRNSARAARLQRRCNETDVPPTSTLATAPIPTPTPTGDDSSSGGGSSSGATPFQNWAGSNLYYAAGLNADQRATLLGGLQKAGMKVLRVWLDGQSSAGTKGTNIDAYPGLEPDNVGTFDDTVLNKLDDFMLDAQKYGIKLMISMHSFNALSGGDVYSKKYGTQGFYENSDAQAAFDARLQHVLNYTHKTLGKRYAELSDYIFAFEAQNEAMIGLGEGYIQQHQDWQCNRAKAIKSALGDSHILITTGGESWANESVQDGFLNCDAIDIVALHAYGSGDFNTDGLKKYVDRAKSAGKMLVMQEWGACYFDSANNNCQQSGVLDQGTRGNNIKNWGKQIIDSGMPWMYWQVLPNADPHYGWDYEVGIDDQGWDAILDASAYAASAQSAWDFSPWLLGSGGDSTPSETATPTSAPTATESGVPQPTTDVPQPTTDAPAPPAATTGNFPKNKVFSGSNLYYAAGLKADTRKYLLQGLKDAGMSVLRVWLDGQGGSPKGTQIDGYGGLEPNNPGTFDDTVLERLDDFMIDAKEYGIKLMVSIHSFNSLSAGNDAYGKKWGTGYFYEQTDAMSAFDNRIAHVLNHKHKTLGKAWKDLPEYIFAFEDQNEAMIGKGEAYVKAHQDWHCGRAKAIKANLPSGSPILSTTGGASWASESWMTNLLTCDALDIIALHAYGAGEFTVGNLKQYVDQATAKGKMVVMQEWGVCYHNASNQCHPSNGVADANTRAKNIEGWANTIAEAGMSWMYWQVIPNDDPHQDWDYEIGIGKAGWDAIKAAGNKARTYDSPVDFSPYLL